ncbi:hypothetical protein HII36_19070 [Nonomuraea sp. NN258]|uniref:hypothetical protein n=1 Tax=Nonomuraea antri TaxID=2730852 RepID=UPI0015692DA1|nr:hypothetical protein [Nonomuraea antri]NRQ33935.1 hypothetical protein [Nonomuraea antri]
MTRYAVDQRRNTLIASWSTGSGDTAVDVADFPTWISSHDPLHLAKALTQLSEACWRCYTHPASAADSHKPNSEGSRRQEERDAFTNVLTALTSPNLPSDGYMIQSFIRVEEAAHQVGRTLHTLNASGLTTAVALDVSAELAAIEQAELGNLSERSRQAVALTREDASPVQVAQANNMLHEHPFGSEALFTEIDPAAAAVAAAHWLGAAATITAEYAGLPATQIVVEADNIEALPHETPTLVLELMAEGASPRQAVMSLIRDALRVAEGEIPHIAALQQRLAAAERLLGDRCEGQPESSLDDLGLRITPLAPARPALDLLEDLLSGIRGCWLLYVEYAAELDQAEDLEDEEWQKRRTASFFAEVREAAASERERLL